MVSSHRSSRWSAGQSFTGSDRGTCFLAAIAGAAAAGAGAAAASVTERSGAVRATNVTAGGGRNVEPTLRSSQAALAAPRRGCEAAAAAREEGRASVALCERANPGEALGARRLAELPGRDRTLAALLGRPGLVLVALLGRERGAVLGLSTLCKAALPPYSGAAFGSGGVLGSLVMLVMALVDQRGMSGLPSEREAEACTPVEACTPAVCIAAAAP